MPILKFEKVVKVCNTLEYDFLDTPTSEGVSIAVVGINKDSFFTEAAELRKALKAKGDTVLNAVAALNQYHHFREKEWKNILDNWGFQSGIESFFKYTERSAYNEHKCKDFSVDRLYRMTCEDHMVYAPGRKLPVSMPIYLDYVGGVANDDFDLDKAYAILAKDSRVSNLAREDIPYYNREDNRNKALKFKVLLPQNEYDKWVQYCQGKSKEYWSCRVQDELIYRSWHSTDLLKLKSAWIGA